MTPFPAARSPTARPPRPWRGAAAPWRPAWLWFWFWIWPWIWLGGIGAGAAWAQEADTPAGRAAAGPPGRVGAVVWIDGAARLQRDDGHGLVDVDPAVLRNGPLTTGDRLTTEAGARAELEVGALRLRLDGGSTIFLHRLDDQALEVQLLQGRLALLLPQDEGAAGLRIDTPSARHRPEGAGQFRFDAGAAGESVTAWRSALAVEWDQARLRLRSGQRAEFLPEGGWRLTLPQADAFARWALLDEAQPLPVPDERLPPQMSGVARLDRHGDWERHPEWGWIWWPRALPPDWAPYRQGRWTWIAPWGWTWIDAAPWGFAPFHYGRWLRIGLRWAWWPGEPRDRAVYLPAPRPPAPWLGPPPPAPRGPPRYEDRRADPRRDPPPHGRAPRPAPRPGEGHHDDGRRDDRRGPGTGSPPPDPPRRDPPEGTKRLPERGAAGPRLISPGDPGPAGRTPDIPARPLPRGRDVQPPALAPHPSRPGGPADGSAGREHPAPVAGPDRAKPPKPTPTHTPRPTPPPAGTDGADGDAPRGAPRHEKAR